MSSYVSTISINDQEWKDIQRKISDTEIYVARRNEEINRLKEERERRESEIRKLREETARVIDSAVKVIQGEYNSALNELEESSVLSIQQKSSTFQSEISELRNDVKLTAKITSDVADKVNRLSQEYSKSIQKVIGSKESASAQANSFLSHFNTLLDEIESLNPCSFDERQYYELKQMRESSKASYDAGNYQSVLIISQNAIAKASDLIASLIISNEMIDSKIAELNEKASKLKQEFDRFDPAVDGAISFELDEELIEYDYDINHWSDGSFGRLKERFDKLYNRLLEVQKTKTSIDELQELEKSVVSISRELTQCDVEARNELLGSLQAQETSGRLCDSLMNIGFELEKYGFEDDDDRNPYLTTYKDGSGNDVSIVVSPGQSACEPIVFLEAFTGDESHTEVLKKKIQASFSNEGIVIEKNRQLDDCHDNSDSNAFIKSTITKANATNRARRMKKFQ